MKENLDQQRARFAWEKVQHQGKDYANLAKGAPALIMSSGLMPVLAFLNEKGKKESGKAHKDLLAHLCGWLQKQFGNQSINRITDAQFAAIMAALMGDAKGDAAAHARFYQLATEETMALLRWIRQFAAAVVGGDGDGGRNG